MWEWDDSVLSGWVALQNTAIMRDHIGEHPFVSCSYWSDTHDTCTAECDAELIYDDLTRIKVWNKFKAAPQPLGYDPAWVDRWSGPTDDSFAVLHLEPWRLRVFPATALIQGADEILNWRRNAPVRL